MFRFEYEIIVFSDLYTVKLTNLRTNVSEQTTTFMNTDGERGMSGGYIGIQAYPDNPVCLSKYTDQGLI